MQLHPSFERQHRTDMESTEVKPIALASERDTKYYPLSVCHRAGWNVRGSRYLILYALVMFFVNLNN